MRYLVFHLLRIYDFSPSFVQEPIHRLTNYIYLLLYKARFLTSANLLPYHSYLVRVSDVHNISRRVEDHNIFSKYLYHGVVLGGEWDLEREPIETVPLFEFSYEVFVANRKMEDTKYYQQILAGKREPYIHGENHLRLRMNKYKKLFMEIRDNGYKSQNNIKGGNFLDEVCISIDRNGHYILEDGRHRFMIAKCLKLKKIPVIVNRVHGDYWEKTKKHWDAHLRACQNT
jgi:hypothetical protein